MTITLEYNPRQQGAKSLLKGILDSGFFKQVEVSASKEEPLYNPEFVNMIKEAQAEPKIRLTQELKKKYFGDL